MDEHATRGRLFCFVLFGGLSSTRTTCQLESIDDKIIDVLDQCIACAKEKDQAAENEKFALVPALNH